MASPFTRLLPILALLLLATAFPQEISRQDTSCKPGSYEIFPGGLHFLPLRANMAEAKMGVLYFPDNANLKVDMGNSVDIVKWYLRNRAQFSVGVEFMAYAQVNSYSGYRLQISALDGFFGGNVTWSKLVSESEYYLRFRYMHNSAHRADGYYDLIRKEWIDGQKPTPFTRDYAEITAAAETKIGSMSIRPYIATSYAARMRPQELKHFLAFAGAELHTDRQFLIPKLPYCWFLAAHAQLNGMPEYQMTYHTQAGIKFGSWEGKGIVLYGSYYFGANYFNEFYYQRLDRFGIGFFIDF